jgi:transposase
MSKTGYRHYPEAFKRQALELLASGERSMGEIERELGITPGLLGKWRQRYELKESQGEAQLMPSELSEAQAEIARLKREVRRLEEEKAILKKAMQIFGQGER